MPYIIRDHTTGSTTPHPTIALDQESLSQWGIQVTEDAPLTKVIAQKCADGTYRLFWYNNARQIQYLHSNIPSSEVSQLAQYLLSEQPATAPAGSSASAAAASSFASPVFPSPAGAASAAASRSFSPYRISSNSPSPAEAASFCSLATSLTPDDHSQELADAQAEIVQLRAALGTAQKESAAQVSAFAQTQQTLTARSQEAQDALQRVQEQLVSQTQAAADAQEQQKQTARAAEAQIKALTAALEEARADMAARDAQTLAIQEQHGLALVKAAEETAAAQAFYQGLLQSKQAELDDTADRNIGLRADLLAMQAGLAQRTAQLQDTEAQHQAQMQARDAADQTALAARLAESRDTRLLLVRLHDQIELLDMQLSAKGAALEQTFTHLRGTEARLASEQEEHEAVEARSAQDFTDLKGRYEELKDGFVEMMKAFKAQSKELKGFQDTLAKAEVMDVVSRDRYNAAIKRLARAEGIIEAMQGEGGKILRLQAALRKAEDELEDLRNPRPSTPLMPHTQEQFVLLHKENAALRARFEQEAEYEVGSTRAAWEELGWSIKAIGAALDGRPIPPK